MPKQQIPAKPPRGYFGWRNIDGDSGRVVITDALHNLSRQENGENHEFGKGVIVGVVSALMGTGMTFDEATKLAWQLCPSDIHPQRLPESWKENFQGKIK